MTPERKQHIIDGLLTVAMLVLVMLGVRAHAATPDVFMPIVRGQAVRLTGQVYPPNGLHCLLQQGTSRVIDPRTDTEVWSCEDAHGHGQVVWSGKTLLLDHVADGSGSLSVTDGVVYITAVRSDGGLQVAVVPTVMP